MLGTRTERMMHSDSLRIMSMCFLCFQFAQGRVFVLYLIPSAFSSRNSYIRKAAPLLSAADRYLFDVRVALLLPVHCSPMPPSPLFTLLSVSLCGTLLLPVCCKFMFTRSCPRAAPVCLRHTCPAWALLCSSLTLTFCTTGTIPFL